MNPLLHLKDDGYVNAEATKAAMLGEFPELSAYPIDLLLGSVAAAIADVKPGKIKRPQYLWLFFLAGRVKGLIPSDQQSSEDTGMRLSPFAWLFAELLIATGAVGSKPRIDWQDTEAVEIEWLNAWAARKLPVGSTALVDAAEIARENPIRFQGNRFLSQVVNMGFALQTLNGEFPFILPANSKVASLLGTTVPTLASAIGKAIRDGYFKVHNAKYNASAGKARTFLFNFDHPAFVDSELIQASRPSNSEVGEAHQDITEQEQEQEEDEI